MTTTDIAPTTKVALLRHLASGKSLDIVATIVHLKREQVLDVASKHGYPDRDKLAWAADVIVKKVEDEASALPDRTDEVRREERRERPALVVDQAVARPSITAPTAGGIEDLIAKGKGHDAKRIQNAANKVLDDIDRLRTLLREDEAKHAERRKAEREKAEARAEVERLKAQLAEAQAKLRGGKKPTAKKAAAAKPARVPGSLDFACRNDGCDKAYDTPQGRSLHERMKCEHRDQAVAS